ncbi:hypothetical protein NGM10_11615 [Halorussus salilacus]|uniref:DUF7526 family protein n=1 Tax=Halorussus salilacus TaxID=2953750 RepID=UPI00209E5B1C|nr:hypothetical protein [Halorussus salilacus]USZ67375.1 hypothetical protein NGM10_11615 [Halorussus salilacus]
MPETIRGQVLHVVPPDELDEHELTDDLQALAESRYVLVCRKGGSPSWVERVRSFLLRRPIEPVTLVAETAPSEGEEVTATVEETAVAGVYEATDLR